MTTKPIELTELPRLLHLRSEHGYTSKAHCSMRAEPEAVDLETQMQLTARATSKRKGYREQTFHDARTQLANAIALFTTLKPPPQDEIRALRRSLERLDIQHRRL